MAKAVFRTAVFLTFAFSAWVSTCFAQQDSVKMQVDTVNNQKTISSNTSSVPISTSSYKGDVKNKTEKTIDSLKSLVRIDSAEKKKLKRKIIPKTNGTISAGYDYGVIPFASNMTYPMGYYSSQGTVGVTPMGLPLNVSYYYSSLKNIAGLNNYFRVSFDPPRYQEMLKEKGLKKMEEEKAKLSNLKNLQQAMEQKLAYQEMLSMNNPSQAILNQKLQEYKDKYGAYQVLAIPNVGADTLKSLPIPSNPYADSIKIITNYIQKYDSARNAINQYRGEIDGIRKQASIVQNKIEFLQNPQNLIYENPYSKKAQALISGIKKMDIGLCYPSYSTFLVNGSTLKGINMEWEKKFYFAFTYGKTINTVMTTNNLIQNQLQTGRNLYNFFDFNNVKDSRKILAIKGGYGKKDGTHFYIGFLYGLGLPSYISAAMPGYVEKNLVLEADGKIAFNSNNSLDLIYGKSSLYQNGLSNDDKENPSQFLFSKFRSNAALLRYNSQIHKTTTKITLTGRLVDPFFNSYGVGFMRSDNIRYELKVDQALGSRVKFSGFYRKDQDNLLKIARYTTNLQTIGANLFIKVSKRMNVRAAYTPVVMQIDSKDSSQYNSQRVNNITNAVLTYMPRAGKVSSLFTVLYSYYQFAGTGGKNNNFQNFNLTNSTTFSPQFRSDLAASYFLNNSSDSLNSNTAMASANISFTSRRGMVITLGGKYAYNTIIQNQVGGLVKISVPLIRYISIEIQAERLVLGDFYNSYNISEIKKFPYYGYGKVIFSW